MVIPLFEGETTMKSLRTKRSQSKKTTRTLPYRAAKKPRKARSTTTRQPKKAAGAPTTDEPKPGLQYLVDLMSLDEAKALVEALESQHRGEVFAKERSRHAEFDAAAKVVFDPERGLPEILSYALAGAWAGPKNMYEGGYYQLSRELEMAIDAQDRIAPVEWQEKPLQNVACVLRGIQHRMNAICSFGQLVAEKSS
jgi:hypothetical protein